MSSPAPTPDLHTGFSAPGATPTPWEDVLAVLASAELFCRPEGKLERQCRDRCDTERGGRRLRARDRGYYGPMGRPGACAITGP
jgi:hypothetical protein